MAAAGVLLALAFAFPDVQGTRLLATSEMEKPEMLRVALCSGSQRLVVQFERRQPDGPNSTGRQTPQNFDRTAGAVFRIVNGAIGADAICVLTDETFLSGGTLIPLKRPPRTARCSTARYPEFQADKGRPVVGCWPIAESPSGLHVAVIEFARRLTNALASLVVIDGDRRIYVDYPARFTAPGDDLWRADDGGDIHADGFDVVFLMKRGTRYFVAIDWAGAEGSALTIQSSDGGEQFKEILTDSWYRSPL